MTILQTLDVSGSLNTTHTVWPSLARHLDECVAPRGKPDCIEGRLSMLECLGTLSKHPSACIHNSNAEITVFKPFGTPAYHKMFPAADSATLLQQCNNSCNSSFV